jgi:DNA mismatch repair protein MutL
MSSSRIHALPAQLANQIAAGEVVERPASVLKELVENSLDAGSSQVDIHIEGAGRQCIRVSDNGQGIHPEDLTLALSRHATSKLSHSEQLAEIGSLGFRGEALPSIASVTRLTLASKQRDQDCGWQYQVQKEAIEPCSQPNGTTITVEELFFNLPARRHFLRSDKTELQHLITTFNRLALSRFDVGFTARFSEQQQVRLPALMKQEDLPQRISKICGRSFIQSAHYVEQQFEDIQLHGWLSPVDAHRAQTDIQYFFINGRVIRDRLINHAIRQAYGEHIPAGRQPAYVLYLTLPLDRVDVNVHPTKHEVRFRDARLIHGLIHHAVEEALMSPSSQDEKPVTDKLNQGSLIKETLASYVAPEFETRPPNSSKLAQHQDKPLLLHQRYAVMLSEPPRLIDLQAAEQHLKQVQFIEAADTATLTSRPILVPVDIEINQAQAETLQSIKTTLDKIGLSLHLTSNHVQVKRIPYLLSNIDLNRLVWAVIDLFKTHGNDFSAITEGLALLIPLTPVTHQAQAEQILSALETAPSIVGKHQKTLDLETLTDLFSN